MTYRRAAYMWMVIGAIAFAASAQAGGFSETVDPSGLRVILAERPGSNLVAASMMVGAGSVRESAEMNGAAHFLEHLLFNGTTSRSQEALYAEVDALGAYNNATTQDDYALFMFMVGTEDARAGFELHADMLFNSTLPPDKFVKEKGIVLEELARESVNDRWRSSVAVDGLFWHDAPLGRPGLGTEASIGGLDRDSVLAYYHTHYVASNMTLLVMGDFDLDHMKAIVADTYGKAARRGRPLPPADGAMTMAPGEGRSAPVDTENPDVHVRFDAPSPDHADAWPFRLLVDLWSQDGGSLEQAVAASPTLPVSSVGASYRTVGGHSYVDLRATLSPDSDVDDAGRTVTRLLAEVQRTVRDGVGEGELARLKTSLRVAESSLSDKIHYYGMMRAPALLNGSPDALARRADDITHVTTADVSRVAETWLADAKPRVVGIGAGFPELDTTYPAVSDPAFAPAYTVASEESVPAVAVRGYERVSAPTGVRHYRLGDGLHLEVESDPRSEVFALHLAARGRSAAEPEGRAGIADFLHRTMLQGTSEWTRAELFARLGAIGANVTTHDSPGIPYDDYYTVPEFSFVRFETIDPYYREACSVLAEMVRAPRVDDASLSAVRADMLAAIAQSDARPSDVGASVLSGLLRGIDGWGRVEGTAATVQAITADDLRTFRDQYFRPENLVITVVTSVDPDSIAAEIARAFADAGSKSLVVTDGSDVAPLPAAHQPGLVPGRPPERVTREMGESQAYAALGEAFEFDPADRPALEAASQVLRSRIAFHVRERLGLAYTVSCGFISDGNVGALAAGIGTRPENVARVIDELAAQVDSVAVADFDDAFVHQLAASAEGRHRMRQITRMGRAYALAVRALGSTDDPDTDIATVTAADVRRVAERYFDSSRAHRVVVQ